MPLPVRLRRALGIVALLLPVLAAPAWSAWSRNPLVPGPSVMPGQTATRPRATVPDGSGGAFVLMQDSRTGDYNLYLERITSQGDVAPGWPVAGLPIVTATGYQDVVLMYDGVSMIPDGTGGVILTWYDGRTGSSTYDVYATRVNAAGSVVAGWPVQLSPMSQMEIYPQVASDGAGGAFFAWELQWAPGDVDIYGAHVLANGTIAWASGLLTPVRSQFSPHIVSDRRGGFLLACLDSLSGVAQVRAARFNSAGAAVSPLVTLDATTGGQDDLAIAADSSGGMFLAWRGAHSVAYEIYATHVDSTCTPTAGWAPNGTTIASGSSPAISVYAMSDPQGGCYFAWEDQRYGNIDVFAAHLTAGGSLAYGWPGNGALLCGAPGSQLVVMLVPDNAGGAIATWADYRGSDFDADVYALRIAPGGGLPPGWKEGGTPVAIAPDLTFAYAACADSAGGALIGYIDYGAGGGTTVSRVQRIDRFGALGNAEPAITKIADVPGDQGGHVQLTWTASYLDAGASPGVTSYTIWRSTTLAAAQAATRAGAQLLRANSAMRPADAASGRRIFRASSDATAAFAWEYLGEVPAHQFATYSYTAPTLVDSSASGAGTTSFLVSAMGAASGAFWDSKSFDGHSVDNVAPTPPAPFSGTYAAGTSHLVWGASPDADIAGYRLYRGGTSGFVPGPGNFVGQVASLAYNDAIGSPYWYKIAAIDAHGNLSGFVTTLPTGTTGADDLAPPHELAFVPMSANPAHGRVAFELDLPAAADVHVSVFDVAGRHVQTLADGAWPAGRHTVTWNGGSTTPAGLYMVVFQSGGQSFRRKVVLAR